MSNCCQMKGPLVGSTCDKLELDPSSFEYPASYFCQICRNFQQALKSCFDAFDAYMLCVRMWKLWWSISGICGCESRVPCELVCEAKRDIEPSLSEGFLGVDILSIDSLY